LLLLLPLPLLRLPLLLLLPSLLMVYLLGLFVTIRWGGMQNRRVMWQVLL
jgi:hypothetical protein